MIFFLLLPFSHLTRQSSPLFFFPAELVFDFPFLLLGLLSLDADQLVVSLPGSSICVVESSYTSVKLLMETSILLPSMISICFLMLLMNQDSHRTAAQMLGISQPAAHKRPT